MHSKKLLYPLILFLVLVIFFFDILFLGKTLSTSSLLSGTTPNGPYGFSGHKPETPFSFDIAGNAWVNEPNPYIIKRSLKEGLMPAWNPYEGLGMPLTANLNTEVLNPLKIILNLSPSPFLQDIFFLLRLFVMGLFTYLYLRETRLSDFSALFGATFFMLSGYSIWWINLHPLSTVMYIPAVFYFYEKWWRSRNRRDLFFISLFISFSLMGGKVPDVIMGLCLLFPYAMWKGFIRDSFHGAFKEGSRLMILTVSGILTASVALLPFLELYQYASPLAKAIRTGASGYSIPFITSVTLVQPLFLGWGNYFYASWMTWTPQVMLPYAGMAILILLCYSLLERSLWIKNLPYMFFSLCVFCIVYGLLPSLITDIISGLPVLSSIEFLKYNSMLYFSMAVVSATALDHILSSRADVNKFYLSIAFASVIILAYFCRLYVLIPDHLKRYITLVLALSLAGMLIIGLTFFLLKNRDIFGKLFFTILILELFLYMPKGHPERANPYDEAPYLHTIRDIYPYRITGSGNSIPPLVSNAVGLYDIRAINVLLPNDYYIFYENLLSFSIPQTNNPQPLFSATSPFSDLVGIRYVLSNEPLDYRRLPAEIGVHVRSLRWVRLFEAMIRHSIKGSAAYGFFKAGDEERFSFIFPASFTFKTKLRVTEPFVFAGFTAGDFATGMPGKVKIRIDDRVHEVILNDKNEWKDLWLDVSDLMGKVITVTIEGEGTGNIALGDFGLSPGEEEEGRLRENLLRLHKKETDFLKFIGRHEGVYIYENINVMDRAFVLHKTKVAGSLSDVIEQLQRGVDFRETALVAETIPVKSISEKGEKTANHIKEKVMIKNYASDEVIMEVESEGGFLVLSDLFYPGWKVKVNGKEEEIIKVFGLLRGVVIHAGKSEVIFCYRPMSLYTGIIVSLLTFVLWLFFFLGKQNRTTHTPEI